MRIQSLVLFSWKCDKIQKRTRSEQAWELQPELNMLISQSFLDFSDMCLFLKGKVFHISPLLILWAFLSRSICFCSSQHDPILSIECMIIEGPKAMLLCFKIRFLHLLRCKYRLPRRNHCLQYLLIRPKRKITLGKVIHWLPFT